MLEKILFVVMCISLCLSVDIAMIYATIASGASIWWVIAVGCFSVFVDTGIILIFTIY